MLVAPPGAGKTTAVAPALLGEPWCTGEVLLLSPRRLAARAAAERMAAARRRAGRQDLRLCHPARHQAIGRDARHGGDRGHLRRNRIQADPELAGVSAVLFDEVHERSLDSDFGLALALDAQAALRPDLRLVAMSATLDGARFAAADRRGHAGDRERRAQPPDRTAPSRPRRPSADRGCDGRGDPDRARRRGRRRRARLPARRRRDRAHRRAARSPACRRRAPPAPRQPRSRRAARRDRPAPAGRRKLVLATSIAETSLTLDGVRIVVDSGLARRPRYDRAAGVTRLVDRAREPGRRHPARRPRRRGRRRAWSIGCGRRRRPPACRASIRPRSSKRTCRRCCSTARCGASPIRASCAGSIRRPTPRSPRRGRGWRRSARSTPTAGRPRMAARSPRCRCRRGSAICWSRAAALGLAGVAAEVAVLLVRARAGRRRRPISRSGCRRWRGERGKRAEAARGLARRWAKLGRSVARVASADDVATCVALAFPDRIARRRDASGEAWASVGGRGFKLDPLSPLAREEWLAVAETQGIAAGARILSAATIDRVDDRAAVRRRGSRRRRERRASIPPPAASSPPRERRLGALRLSGGPDDSPDRAAIAAALVEGVRARRARLCSPGPRPAPALRERAAFARRFDRVAARPLRRGADRQPRRLAARRWSRAGAGSMRSRPAISPARSKACSAGTGGAALDRLAPDRLTTPAGSSHPIDYAADGGPTVEMRPAGAVRARRRTRPSAAGRCR